ncbi:hypothetical protein D9M68_883070 [compost metagenome]
MSARLPATFSVPMELTFTCAPCTTEARLPAASTPPDKTLVAPTVPEPVRVAPEKTVVRLDGAIDPETTNVPPSTSVLPV